jgi:hypothetical protein
VLPNFPEAAGFKADLKEWYLAPEVALYLQVGARNGRAGGRAGGRAAPEVHGEAAVRALHEQHRCASPGGGDGG